MNSNTMPNFSEGMMRIRELSSYKDKDCFTKYLSGVNSIRSNYQWSQKTYDVNNIENVYLVSSNGPIFGFIECTYQNMEVWSDTPIKIYLHEIHIAPSMHRKGVGSALLKHLLKKGVPLEMVVANENTTMLALVDKYDAEHKHITTNTRTVLINP